MNNQRQQMPPLIEKRTTEHLISITKLIFILCVQGCLEAKREQIYPPLERLDQSHDQNTVTEPKLQPEVRSRPEQPTSEIPTHTITSIITAELSRALHYNPSSVIERFEALINHGDHDCPSRIEEMSDDEVFILIDEECEREDGTRFRGMISLVKSGLQDETYEHLELFGDDFLVSFPTGEQLYLSGAREIIREQSEELSTLSVYAEGILSGFHDLDHHPDSDGDQDLSLSRISYLQEEDEEGVTIELNGAWLLSPSQNVSALSIDQLTLSQGHECGVDMRGEVHIRGSDHRWRTLHLGLNTEGEYIVSNCNECGSLAPLTDEPYSVCFEQELLHSIMPTSREIDHD